jgi:hypothetical protein
MAPKDDSTKLGLTADAKHWPVEQDDGERRSPDQAGLGIS